MNKKCPECSLVNFGSAEVCVRCNSELGQNLITAGGKSGKANILRRIIICLAVLALSIFSFYLSLIGSAERLKFEQKEQLNSAIRVLEEKGFSSEAFLLNNLTVYRSNDNWLNASVEKENAYAATNFPFQVMTLYNDFFDPALDDTSRAAILLHEAQHLAGADEKEAYHYVWKNRAKLGWDSENYGRMLIYRSVAAQTREYVPEIFTCEWNQFGDCNP